MINEKVSNEELEAFIAEPVNGMVMMPNRYLAVAMAKELLAFRKASSEPVADVVPWSHPTEERTCDIRWRRHDVAPGPLYAVPQSATDALREAVNAIYFNDSSDYLSALWSVVRSISPETAQLLEENERAAFEQVNPDFKK